MIGKKKTYVWPLSFHPRNFALNTSSGQDVQFFREASDVQFDETGNRKRKYRYGDEDEIEMEQQERKRRQAWLNGPTEEEKVAWQESERKRLSFRTLSDRAAAEALKVEAKRDQKQTDEHAARQAYYKR